MLTPGTVIEEGMLAARRNNRLAAVVIEPAQDGQACKWELTSTDVSTGEFLASQLQDSAALHQELAQLDAAELL